MKTIRRISALLIAVVMVLCTITPVFATTSTPSVKGEAGETVSVKFTYNGIANIDGTFTYSNKDLFSSASMEVSGLVGSYNHANGKMFCYSLNGEAVNCVITLKLKISDTATPGSSSTISFKYEKSADGNMPSVPDYHTDSATVTVKAKPIDYSELEAQIAVAEGLNKNDYTQETWTDVETALAEAKAAKNSDDQSVVNTAAKNLKNAIAALEKVTPAGVDYTELNKQIKKAESLDKNSYTEASWKKMQTALAAAKAAKNSDDQNTVNTAATNLKKAIAALVKVGGEEETVDYTELNNTIATAEKLTESDYTQDSWNKLSKALDAAREATKSDSQNEVDEANKALKEAIEGLKEAETDKLIQAIKDLEEYTDTEKLAELWMQMHDLLNEVETAKANNDQEKLQELAEKMQTLLTQIKAETEALKQIEKVEVPTDPTGDYCNVEIHRIWPILFFVSLALNVIAIIFILLYFLRKKKNTK